MLKFVSFKNYKKQLRKTIKMGKINKQQSYRREKQSNM